VLDLAHGCRLHLGWGTPGRRHRPGHGNERICGQRGSERRCSGKYLATIHVLIRPDGYDRGNPRVRPGGQEGNGRLIAEQLEAQSSGRPAQQVTVEVVWLLMVVDPIG
jgi:hypothetical protein